MGIYVHQSLWRWFRIKFHGHRSDIVLSHRQHRHAPQMSRTYGTIHSLASKAEQEAADKLCALVNLNEKGTVGSFAKIPPFQPCDGFKYPLTTCIAVLANFTSNEAKKNNKNIFPVVIIRFPLQPTRRKRNLKQMEVTLPSLPVNAIGFWRVHSPWAPRFARIVTRQRTRNLCRVC